MEMWAPKAFTLEGMSHMTVPGIGTGADGNRMGQYQFVSVNAIKERSVLGTLNRGVVLASNKCKVSILHLFVCFRTNEDLLLLFGTRVGRPFLWEGP